MKSTAKILVILLFTLEVSAQNINEQFEKIALSEDRINISSIALSPDGNILAVGCGSKTPLYLYDWKKREITNEIQLNAKYTSLGYKVYFSAKGNYLLLQEQKIAYNPSKPRKVPYAIVDLNNEEVIHQFPNIEDVKISSDEKYVFSLENGVLFKRELNGGRVIKSKAVKYAGNALAISKDGSKIILSHKPHKQDLSNVPSIRNDKKAIKPALKFREMVSVFDSESFEKIETVPEIYDIVNQLHYSPDGNKILVYSVPHHKVNDVGHQGYVNVIDANSLKPKREAYLSRSTFQPDFEYNQTGSMFGISSVETFPTLNIYNVEQGNIIDMFDTKNRIGKSRKKGFYPGTNSGFVFLPLSEEIIMAYGNSLIYWKLENK